MIDNFATYLIIDLQMNGRIKQFKKNENYELNFINFTIIIFSAIYWSSFETFSTFSSETTLYLNSEGLY